MRAIALLDGVSGPMRTLGMRLRRMGYPVVACKTPDHAERLLRERGEAIGAVVLPVDLPTFDLRAALRFLRRLEPSGELTFMATGQRPNHASRQLLRGAGVELALWLPVDDHTLRFQANRALAASAVVRGARTHLRAPTDLPIAVWSGERRKPARVYTLSAGGAYLATWRPNVPGAALRLELPLPSGELRVGARVVMANVPGHFLRGNLPVGMGVRFERIFPDVALSLRNWADTRQRTLGF